MATKKRVAVRPSKSPQWEETAEELINSTESVSYYPQDGEIYLNIRGSEYRSIVLSKDGTWRLD